MIDVFASTLSVVLSHLYDTVVEGRKAQTYAVQGIICLLHVLSSLID